MDFTQLSRREREIMDVVYRLSSATASQVVEGMTDPPTQTAVRTFLRSLEQKGYLRHHKRGRQFVYEPTSGRERAGISALRRVLNVFFNGSLEHAVAAHFAEPKEKLSDDEVKRLKAAIDAARRKRGQ